MMLTTMQHTTIPAASSELRAARERAGLTRAQLAGLAGCSLSTITNIEHGAVPRRSPILDRLWSVLADRPTNGTEQDARPT
jgi:transcriptional regulator with XRE-family HTH domain